MTSRPRAIFAAAGESNLSWSRFDLAEGSSSDRFDSVDTCSNDIWKTEMINKVYKSIQNINNVRDDRYISMAVVSPVRHDPDFDLA
jgi:hypothetical protein